MKKAIIEIEGRLTEGQLLMYKGGKLVSVEVHELLPDLAGLKDEVCDLEADLESAKAKLAELARIIKEK